MSVHQKMGKITFILILLLLNFELNLEINGEDIKEKSWTKWMAKHTKDIPLNTKELEENEWLNWMAKHHEKFSGAEEMIRYY